MTNFEPSNLCLASPLGVTPSEFRQDLWGRKTIVPVLSYVWHCCHYHTFNYFGTIEACDRRTDWQTDAGSLAWCHTVELNATTLLRTEMCRRWWWWFVGPVEDCRTEMCRRWWWFVGPVEDCGHGASWSECEFEWLVQWHGSWLSQHQFTQSGQWCWWDWHSPAVTWQARTWTVDCLQPTTSTRQTTWPCTDLWVWPFDLALACEYDHLTLHRPVSMTPWLCTNLRIWPFDLAPTCEYDPLTLHWHVSMTTWPCSDLWVWPFELAPTCEYDPLTLHWHVSMTPWLCTNLWIWPFDLAPTCEYDPLTLHWPVSMTPWPCSDLWVWPFDLAPTCEYDPLTLHWRVILTTKLQLGSIGWLV